MGDEGQRRDLSSEVVRQPGIGFGDTASRGGAFNCSRSGSGFVLRLAGTTGRSLEFIRDTPLSMRMVMGSFVGLVFLVNFSGPLVGLTADGATACYKDAGGPDSYDAAEPAADAVVVPDSFDAGGPVECGVAVMAGCRGDFEQTECESSGGRYVDQRFVFTGCMCPTPDFGCACTNSNECAGECLNLSALGPRECTSVREGTCSQYFSALSCACVLGPDGVGIALGEARYRCS